MLDDIPFLGGNEGWLWGFVALHPFVFIPEVDPADCIYGTEVFERSDIPAGADMIGWADEQSARRNAGKTMDTDTVRRMAKRSGQGIGWTDIAERCRLADQRAVHRALCTTIKALRPEYADEEGAERLTALCRAERFFPPTEGESQAIMENEIAAFLHAAGATTVIWSDEFGLEPAQEITVRNLLAASHWNSQPGVPDYRAWQIATPDGGLAIQWPWDEFVTLILGREALPAGVRPEMFLEGFHCAPDTGLDWIWQEPQPLLRPSSRPASPSVALST